MDNDNGFKNFIINELRNYEIHNKSYIGNLLKRESKIIHILEANKNNEIRVHGKASEELERIINEHYSYAALLFKLKKGVKTIDISMSDTMDEITQKVQESYSGELQEEDLLECHKLEELRQIRKEGLEKELEYLDQKKEEEITEKKATEMEYAYEIAKDENPGQDEMLYQLRYACSMYDFSKLIRKK